MACANITHQPNTFVIPVLERELKLYVPEQSRKGLLDQIAALNPSIQPLHAIYFDTPSRTLAKTRVALRLRLEGEQWIQTLKAAGPDELSKLEYNHVRPTPTLDLTLYDNLPAAAVVQQHAAQLAPRYETRIERHHVRMDCAGSIVEIALDNGVIQSGHVELPVNEIEFELIEGDVASIFQLGAQWMEQFGLIIDLRSKSERGDILAQVVNCGATSSEAVHDALYQAYRLHTHAFPTIHNLQQGYVDSALLYLGQIIRNASLLAGIDGHDADEEQQATYLALMRVGMRRLRSCRRLFSPWMSTAEQAATREMRPFFAMFGEARDSDLLSLETLPRLMLAGLPGPALVLPTTASTSAEIQQLAASSLFQRSLLNNLAQLLSGQSLVEEENHNTQPKPYLALHAVLRAQLQSIQLRSQNFAELSQRQQHRLRNRIKTLRYCLEFLGTSSHRPLYDALRNTQHFLGKITDCDVTHEWCQQHLDDPEQRYWALGWLTATRQHYVKQAKKVLKQLVHAAYPE
ncbi:CHAD domain-containing protein [Paenalcaligenes sp. Me131]|uniref:CYTH and CHAD domain-containing protein n=1 Tax=Paenalcaligenes sp. Me131 TaxID=3392636 RepID=UPI003D2BC313